MLFFEKSDGTCSEKYWCPTIDYIHFIKGHMDTKMNCYSSVLCILCNWLRSLWELSDLEAVKEECAHLRLRIQDIENEMKT